MRTILAASAALALGACSTLEAVTDPVTGRVTGLAGLALDTAKDGAGVLWANDRGIELPQSCEHYASLVGGEGPPEDSIAALAVCKLDLDAMERTPQASVEIIVSPS